MIDFTARGIAYWMAAGIWFLYGSLAGGAPDVVRSFDGESGPGLAVCETGITHCYIPEMDVAVNGKEVVQVTWQNVRVYDYGGKLVKSTPMAKLIRDAGLDPIPPEHRPNSPNAPGPFEPHVVYDEFIQRWIITVTCHSDCMLVSASSDPAGAWGGVYLSCGQGGPCLDFDPALHIGFDKNGVYYCGGHMGDDNPHTIPKVAYDCFAVPHAEVTPIAKGTAPAHINRRHNMPLDVMPAIDHNASKSASAPALFLTKTCDRVVMGACQNAMEYSFDWIVDSFTWKGSSGSWGEQLVKTDVGSKQNKWLYSKPCCGQLGTVPQKGSDAIELRVAESHRLSNLVQHGSKLYGAMPSGPCRNSCGTQGADTTNVLFWAEVDCAKPTSCVVTQTGKIAAPDVNPAFPTMGVDKDGNLGIVAVSSSAKTDLSVLLWTMRKGDKAFSGPTTVVAGTQPYTCMNTKSMATIGNAVGVLTALDPADGTKLWTSEQWSNDAARCVWNTRIVQYQVGGSAAKATR